MAPKSYDLAAGDEDERSCAIEPVRLPVNSTALTKLSTMDRHAEFHARDGEQFSSNNNVSNESAGQRKAAKVPPRTRILSAAAELFLRHGIAGVSVETIAKASATGKPTLYYHFVSKDELVTQYLREAAKRLDACWVKIGPPSSASAPVRVIKTYKALQRRRLTRLCRAAALRNPSIFAHALLLLFDGACITAPSVGGRIDLSFRFFLGSKAMIAAHAKAPSARRQVQHP
jgi:hypothetical protein